ncbi:uncharacterized protein MONOS_15430 [Monocercomonoides exilis]|uniref:uncharacterized protein n=1 Tax=Monocercomonoides exilis TaxID=2049356 RepID=UPI003559C8AA|nr:hypothetical protein MONOS_15430 [Monocercomonoides exilis]|eukprot:MONOS_15430.1-p1 / transcript=MONOS_15430.1 / gene=MONOS_15430 / organism=Monocercomonoides_exilis_PA203 / gene_product=unspecified product / transcript_product=unspecified product / location=Mono_scaffold01230:2279-2804(+) / protein_length=114 / sequence_SO=supercontig / SO=protein_coding / is_pseudo=false
MVFVQQTQHEEMISGKEMREFSRRKERFCHEEHAFIGIVLSSLRDRNEGESEAKQSQMQTESFATKPDSPFGLHMHWRHAELRNGRSAKRLRRIFRRSQNRKAKKIEKERAQD